MRRLLMLLAVFVGFLLLPSTTAEAQKKDKPRPPGKAKKHQVPPGHAKRGCLPPGLAKKFGNKPPCKVYVAVDPQHHDRIWFLIDDKWVLNTGLAETAQQELKATLKIEVPEPPKPPIPLPKVDVDLQILLFSD